MVITIPILAEKIAGLAEIIANPNILMHNSIPNSLALALIDEGLTVVRTDFSGLSSLNTGIVLVRDSTIINNAIRNKKLTSPDFLFVFLIIFDEESIEGDMDEQFETVRKGTFEFDPGETIHFGIFKLTRLWVNQ